MIADHATDAMEIERIISNKKIADNSISGIFVTRVSLASKQRCLLWPPISYGASSCIEHGFDNKEETMIASCCWEAVRLESRLHVLIRRKRCRNRSTLSGAAWIMNHEKRSGLLGEFVGTGLQVAQLPLQSQLSARLQDYSYGYFLWSACSGSQET